MQISLPWCDNTSDANALACLMVMGSMNYRFWHREVDGSIRKYRINTLSGAQALMSVFEAHWGDSANDFRNQLHKCGHAALFGDIPAPDSRQTLLMEKSR